MNSICGPMFPVKDMLGTLVIAYSYPSHEIGYKEIAWSCLLSSLVYRLLCRLSVTPIVSNTSVSLAFLFGS